MSTELTPAELDNLADPRWRIRNLYWIVDRNAQVIRFVPNAAQEDLLDKLHHRNIILKARQRGFSTLIQLLALDQALFNDNYTAGIIADNLDNAARFLKRIEFAYKHLPAAIQMATPMVSRNSSLIEFGNGSSINVDTSFRSGSLQFLHVSEFGKICAKAPDKAKEIKTGTIPALAPDGIGFIESTAEGHEGYFFDMVMAAQNKALSGTRLTQLDWKYFFYSWWDEQEYKIDPASIRLTDEEKTYCAEIEAKIGQTLEPERWAWYWATRRQQGEDMLQEFPSTPDEAFWHSVEGRYYTEQLIRARKEGRIGRFQHLPDRPVYTWWDIGANDDTAIWCMQIVNGRLRFIKYHEKSAEPYNYFVEWLQALRYTWATHYLPHDAEHKRQQGLVISSPLDMLQELAPNWHFDTVPRIPDITHGIQQVRMMFPIVEIDEEGCAQGIARLDAYRKEWNDRTAAWKSTPFHGPESDGADAFRQCAQHYADGELPLTPPVRVKSRAKPTRSWRTA